MTAFGHLLSFGLSQFHGHGSWLECEMALIADCSGDVTPASFLSLIYFGKNDARVVGRSCSSKLNVHISGWRLVSVERKR